jgi:hypothetical protein
MRYLYISSDKEGQIIFPSSAYELALTLIHGNKNNSFLHEWPSNSHGPAFPMNKYKGTIILDLEGDEPTKPLTYKQIAKVIKDGMS